MSNVLYSKFTACRNLRNLVSISVRATPVPIPNTTVKPNGAHDTAGEALWESRLSPVIGSLAQLVRATGS